MKHILILTFSIRKNGNCDICGQVVYNTLKNDDFEIEKINIATLNLMACKGCFGCNNSEFKCIMKDDLDEIKEKINNADAIILITPCFIFSAPASMKIIMDRLAAWALNKIENGTKQRIGIGISIAGAPDEWHSMQRAYPSLFLKLFNCDIAYLKTFDGIGLKGEILLHPDLLDEIQHVASALKLKLLQQEAKFPSDNDNKDMLLCPNCHNDVFRVIKYKKYICSSCGATLKPGIFKNGYKISGLNKLSPVGAIEHTTYIGGKIANAFEATDEIAKRVLHFQTTGDFDRTVFKKKEIIDKNNQIEWADDGLAEFQRIVPKGFQSFVKKAVERKAIEQGHSLITREVFLDIKKKSGN